jgi:glucosyl-dolichyl phosphate glucuronosyltransferase
MIRNDFVSVIIPTRNRFLLLDKVLKSLLRQTLSVREFEIIIIDNGSTDNTQDVVEAVIPLLPNLRYIYEPNLGLLAGRHRGFQEAQGDILVYADDDIEAFPTWLETIKACFLKENVAMVGGKNLPKFEISPPEWLLSMWQPNTKGERVLTCLSILDLGDDQKAISPYFVFGCNFSIRRSVLEEARGFHPDGMPQHLLRYRGDGESYISQYVASKGYTAFYHPNASVYHWVSAKRMEIEYFCCRVYSQGISDSYTHFRKVHGLYPPADSNILEKLLDTISMSVTKVQSISSQIFEKYFTHTQEKFFKRINCLNCDIFTLLQKSELKQIQIKMTTAYRAGYAFHQQEVFKDPTLLRWVLKPDYWDYRLPGYSETKAK